jgi:hypothetical protein
VIPIKECRDEYYMVIVLSKVMREDQASLLEFYSKTKVWTGTKEGSQGEEGEREERRRGRERQR